MKKTAFTLIELLVTIVIVGILSSISVSTFQGFQEQARDARRTSALSTVNKIIQNQGVFQTGSQLYTNTRSELEEYFQENQFGLLGNDNGYCFQYLSAEVNNVHDNQFFLGTWGESTSTDQPGTPGMLYVGTPLLLAKFTDLDQEDPTIEEVFRCENWVDYTLTTENRKVRDWFFGLARNGVQRFFDPIYQGEFSELVFIQDGTIVCRGPSDTTNSCD